MMRSAILVVFLLALSPPLRADETARAKAHFVKAEAHFSLGEFRPALEEYRRTYLLRPLPPLLFNMAQCHRHLGELERAAFLLRRFLESRPTAAQRAQAEAVLAIVERARGERSRAASAPATQRASSSPAVRVRLPVAPEPASRPLVAPPAAPAVRRVPLHRRWWFWAALGGVATGLAVGVAAGVAGRGGDHPAGSLPSVDWR